MKYTNWLKDYYGSKEKNKSSLGVGVIFGILSFWLILAIYFIDDIIMKIAFIYMMAVFFSCAMFIFSAYFFEKKENKDKFKVVKYSIFIVSLLLLSVVFSPIVLVEFVREKIKFQSFFEHGTKYAITICIPLFFALLVGVYVNNELENVQWLKVSTVSSLITFLLWRSGSIGLLKVYCKIGKKRLSESAYLAIKKDLYVIVFAMITVFTIVANCVILEGIEKDLVDGITKAFAVYIAVDRLSGKWKSANDSYEKEKEHLEKEMHINKAVEKNVD